MEILLPLIFGGVCGAVAHFLMPGRPSRGAALAPVLGALCAGVCWLAFTWAQTTTTSPWIWIASLAAPIVIVPLVLAALTRSRARHDARERARLRIS